MNRRESLKLIGSAAAFRTLPQIFRMLAFGEEVESRFINGIFHYEINDFRRLA